MVTRSNSDSTPSPVSLAKTRSNSDSTSSPVSPANTHSNADSTQRSESPAQLNSNHDSTPSLEVPADLSTNLDISQRPDLPATLNSNHNSSSRPENAPATPDEEREKIQDDSEERHHQYNLREGSSLECELCPAAQRELPLRNGSRYGVFTGESRKSQFAKHLKLRHNIAADKIRAGCKMCGYVSMGKYSLKDVRAHIKKEHEAGRAEPVRARGAARAARPNSCRDNNNNNIIDNNSNAGGSGEIVNSNISSQNDRATAAEIIGTNHGAAPSGSTQNRREEDDGPEEDSPGLTIVRTRRAARQRLLSMSDTDDSINISVHEQQQHHQLACNNTSVSPDVQRHQHVTTRTQPAAATTQDSGSVTPPQTTPLSSRVTNANVSHSPESPRRRLRPRAAATQQLQLQTTSRARHATSVPAESQGSQRQQLLPKRTLRSTQESAEGRKSTTSTATQRAAPSTSRQQRSTSPTALARRSGSTRSNVNSSASASTSRKSGSSPPAVRTTRAERLRLEKRARETTTTTRATPPPSRSSTSGTKRRTQDNAPQRRSSSQQHQAGPSRIRSPATTYAEATRGQTSPRASVSGEDIDISRASPTVTATGSMAATTSIAATLTTTTTTVSVCSGSIASAVSRPINSMDCQRPEEVQVQLLSQTPALSAVERTPSISGDSLTPAVAEAATTSASPSPATPSAEATAEEDWRVVGRSRRRSSAPTPPVAEQERRTAAASEKHHLRRLDTPRRNVDVPRATIVPGSRQSVEETGLGDRHRPDRALDVSGVRVVRREQEPPRGNGARGNGRRGGRAVAGRGPTAEQTALIDLACLTVGAQQLEHTATLAAEYLSRFTERRARGPAGGGRRNRRANDARGRQRNGDDPAAGAGDGAGPVTREGWVAAATRIQRLYRKNRRRAVQEVVNGAPQHCEISVAEVQRHFEDVHSVREPGGALPPLFNAEPPTAASNAALVRPFERAEVSLKLKGMNNSSPGPDGVTYWDLKRADPGCHVLAALFNACLRTGLVPQCWKSSSTILLHKKGDRADIGNWRPIAMGDTTAKLFASLVADRLTTWAVVNQRISPSQKGFLPYEGCLEHNFVLGEILRDAKARRKEVVVAWLDLSNAFGSVPHASIHEALDRHSVPLPIRNLVRSSYEEVSTSVKTAGAITDPVRILSGVRQGCPLSPIVFNLALEPVVRAVQATGRGYALSGQTYNNLFYADDGALVSDSPDGMRLLLRSAEDAAAAVGLRFNPSKSATLHLKGAARARGPRHAFFFHPRVGDALHARRRGLRTSRRTHRLPDQSLLAPWQKLEVAAAFILPRLDFCLQGSHVEKGPLSEADKVVKKLAKGWMHLPQRASAEVVFLPPNMGGGGILPLADMADLYTVAHAFKLLSSRDAAVAGLARSSLECVAAKRLGRIAAEQDLADYLSGVVDGDFARPSAGTASLWSRARNAARRASAALGLRWVWCAERRELGVECRGPSGNTITVTPQARSQVVRRLRSALVAHYRDRLLAKKDQGKVYEVTSRSRVGNHFLRNGSFTRFAEWRFIHRARLDVLPLNATKRWQTGGDKRCRKCGAHLETLPHVIQHCRSNYVAITKRHDGVLDRLVKALKIPGTVSVNRNSIIPWTLQFGLARMAEEPQQKVVLENGVFTLLLPVSEDERLLCPACPARRGYSGNSKIENLLRHQKDSHADAAVVFQCWGCGYTAPPDKRYPRKEVTKHCGDCLPEFHGVRAGLADAARRAGIRGELRGDLPPAERHNNGRRAAAERARTPSPAPAQSGEVSLVPDSDAVASLRHEVVSPPAHGGWPPAQQPAMVSPRSLPAFPSSSPGAGAEPDPPPSPPSPDAPVPDPTRPARLLSAAEDPVSQPAVRRRANPEGARRPNPERNAQRELVAELRAITSSDQLEEVMGRVNTFLSRLTWRREPAPRRRRNVPQRPVDRTTEAKRLQRLYRLNKKRAAQQILAGPNRTCEVNIANTERFFTNLAAHRVGGEDWPNVFDRPGPTPDSTEHLCRPIEIGEVHACLGRRANSSPGPDGVTYADLKRADPGSRVLAALFDAVWRTEGVPSCWSESNTILLYKKGDPGDIGNWRPISLADTVPKLFAAVLADRVKEWAVTNAVYSKSQKGFLQFEGCFEHNFILQEILRDAKDRKREVMVAWLDLSNAFPSLPHSSIFRALEGHGMPLKVRNVIASLYADMRTKTVKERLQRQATNIEMAAYLSNDLEVPRSGARTSFWAQVRASVIRLKKKLGLKWRWCSEQETFHLDCGDGAAFSVSPGQKHQATAILRKCLVEHYAGTLLGKKDQGKSFEVIRKSKVSNHFLRSGRNTRFCDWRFIHRARLNVLPVNATLRWLTEADKRCRRCGAPSETLPHVLNHCTVHSAARQRRHNEVQDRLVKACARNPCPIRVNHSVQGIHGTLAALRPDIVLRDEIHRRVHIVDVCIPFENRLVAFTEAREEKRTKYAALAEQLRGQGYTVDVDAFVVGALGGWDGRNEAVLNRLGVSSRYAAMMRRFMVSDTIRWGRDIYVEHLSGERQYRQAQ
ncbi:unnamed protein product [Trichogramma brassicae]|uniref:Reverse transcriptase domain-containing protein n=1 Tax=Trichogramma brassicae TaxID=86971 RepID=A0A6H5I925_9HYME|nr:unnamed protein product [Trichogramma brassicae]